MLKRHSKPIDADEYHGLLSAALADRLRTNLKRIVEGSGLESQLREFVWTSPEGGDSTYVFEFRLDVPQEKINGIWVEVGDYLDQLMDAVSSSEQEQLLNMTVWVLDSSASALV